MKTIFYLLAFVIVLWLTYVLFNAVYNSDLPPFWKWIILG